MLLETKQNTGSDLEEKKSTECWQDLDGNFNKNEVIVLAINFFNM